MVAMMQSSGLTFMTTARITRDGPMFSMGETADCPLAPAGRQSQTKIPRMESSERILVIALPEPEMLTGMGSTMFLLALGDMTEV
jgi:hypothetical protein